MSPLIKSKSKEAIGKNMKAEMEAGKPKAQSLAIALNVQKASKKKKMAEGGAVEPSPEPTSSSGESIAQRIMREKRSTQLDFNDDEGMHMDAIKKENYAMGGEIEEEDEGDSLISLNKHAHEEAESMDEEESEHSGSPMDALNESMASAIRRKLSSKRGE
jgi:hypothetical protein